MTVPNTNQIDDEQLAARKAFLKLTPDDERAVAELRQWFDRIGPELIENFYAHLLSHESTASHLRDPALVKRLKRLQRQYFEDLVSGRYDADFASRRLAVGRRHQQIGLEPRWYLGAYNIYMQECFPTFARSLGGDVPPQLLSLLKVILLDIGLTLETYFATSTQRLRQHNEELEEALQMYFQSETKARQYTKLAGHEIRGSLNAIGNVLEEVVEDFAHEIPDEARDALQAAHDRCHHVTEVVEKILGEPEHAGVVRWIETSELLSEIQDRMPVYAAGRDVRLALPIDSVRVQADPVALREVFANLVSNAVRHMDKPRGEIRIEHHVSGDRHIFSVVDNGPGIPPGQQPRIFQPFYRAGSGTHSGKGLGLYFVRRIVEQHGGQVWVDSVEGSGSRFSFSLPIEPLNHNGSRSSAA